MSKPRRTRTEQIEDLFWDLEFSEKQTAMKNITSLYRQAERSRAPEQPAKSQQSAAPNGADGEGAQA